MNTMQLFGVRQVGFQHQQVLFTSALDNLTQKQVTQSLDRLKCTRIVVAHRLSTIRQCGRIILLEDGAILEDGSYDELMARKGSFAQLVKRQQLEPEEQEERPA